jgi:hypothetical protein
VVGQKRRIELTRQLQQISFRDDKPLLDRRTGTFYRQSDVTAHGITAATPLGRIDVAVEEGIFKVAVDIAKFGQLFHGAGHANPIVLDDGTGRVYPANNPSETCGYLKPGPTVDSPGL